MSPYDTWENVLDLICRKRLGLGLHDLPDVATRDGFDQGSSPEEFFEEEVVPRMQEDHGALIAEALGDDDETSEGG
jgi:hypothetical protein